MNEKIIKNCLAFLERVQLQGNEVPAYLEIVHWLNETARTPEPQIDEGNVLEFK